MKIAACSIVVFLCLLVFKLTFANEPSTRIMIKHGDHYVSLKSENNRLFLSKNDPPLMLYKSSLGVLRNKKGDKCIGLAESQGLYLHTGMCIAFTYFTTTTTYKDILFQECWNRDVEEIRLEPCTTKRYGFMEEVVPEPNQTPTPGEVVPEPKQTPTPTPREVVPEPKQTPTPTPREVVPEPKQTPTPRAAQPIQQIFPTAFFTNILFTGKRFVGHVSKTMQVKSVERCFMVCLECIQTKSTCYCSSFNIKRSPPKSSSSLLCEINDSNHHAIPRDLVEGADYQYYEVM